MDSLKKLILFLYIAISGIPFFSESGRFLLIPLFLLTFLVFIFSGEEYSNRKTSLVIILFLLIELFQILFTRQSIITSFGTLIKMYLGYMILKILREQFVEYYIVLMYKLSIVSLVIFTLSLIPGVYDLLLSIAFKNPLFESNNVYRSAPNIIFYTISYTIADGLRNAGPFWEPGGFSVFLCLAIIFNILVNNELNNKYNIIFIITIITTVSTGGYLTLFVIIIGYFISKKVSMYKFLYFPVILVCFFFMYSELDFLGNKVQNNILSAEETTGSRFGSALIDIHDFVNSPYFGWGRGESRLGGREYYVWSQEQHRNNGLTNLLASYGALIFIVSLFLYYSAFFNISKLFKLNKVFVVFAFIAFILMLFSQNLPVRPYFYSFLLISTVFPTMNRHEQLSQHDR